MSTCPKNAENRSVKPVVSRTTCGQPRGQVDNLRDKSEEQLAISNVQLAILLVCKLNRAVFCGQPMGQVGQKINN